MGEYPGRRNEPEVEENFLRGVSRREELTLPASVALEQALQDGKSIIGVVYNDRRLKWSSEASRHSDLFVGDFEVDDMYEYGLARLQVRYAPNNQPTLITVIGKDRGAVFGTMNLAEPHVNPHSILRLIQVEWYYQPTEKETTLLYGGQIERYRMMRKRGITPTSDPSQRFHWPFL